MTLTCNQYYLVVNMDERDSIFSYEFMAPMCLDDYMSLKRDARG